MDCHGMMWVAVGYPLPPVHAAAVQSVVVDDGDGSIIMERVAIHSALVQTHLLQYILQALARGCSQFHCAGIVRCCTRDAHGIPARTVGVDVGSKVAVDMDECTAAFGRGFEVDYICGKAVLRLLRYCCCKDAPAVVMVPCSASVAGSSALYICIKCCV